MITDKIKNYKLYSPIHKDLEKVFEFMSTIDENTECKKYVFDEDNVWVSVFESNPDESAEMHFEAHKNFIDIQLVVSGSEDFGYANTETLKECIPYDKEKDIFFLDGEVNSISLKKGDFIIVYPQDAHIPAMKKTCTGKLIRAVGKIRIGQ